MAVRISSLPAGIVVLAALPSGLLGQPSSDVHDFLSRYAEVTQDDLNLLEGEQVLMKPLHSEAKQEIAVLAAVRIHASTEFFLRMINDIEGFRSGWGTTKRISDPPVPEDFESLMWPEQDFAALRKCKVGQCDLKLGEAGINQLQGSVDWESPDAAEQARAILRQRAFQFASDYCSGGNAALGEVRDKKRPTLISKEFVEIVEHSPYLVAHAPELREYLLRYPQARPPRATDFLYWTVDEVTFPTPTLRATHVTIQPLAEGENASTLIASKHIYFSRLFHTGLDILALVRDEGHGDENWFYAVAITRVRTDALSGFFGRVVRDEAVKTVREAARKYIEILKEAIERYYRDEGGR